MTNKIMNKSTYLKNLLKKINGKNHQITGKKFAADTIGNQKIIGKIYQSVVSTEEYNDMFGIYLRYSSHCNTRRETTSYIQLPQDIIDKYDEYIETFSNYNDEQAITLLKQGYVHILVNKLINKLDDNKYGLSYPEFINLVYTDKMEKSRNSNIQAKIDKTRRYLIYMEILKNSINECVPYDEFIKNPEEYEKNANHRQENNAIRDLGVDETPELDIPDEPINEDLADAPIYEED